jgi:hypothetical protein
MPALNFQAQFAPMIESGAKVLTMRVPRKDGRFPCPMDAKNPLRLYTGLRQRGARLLLEVERPSVIATVTFDQTGYRWCSQLAHGPLMAARDRKALAVVRAWRDSRDAVQGYRDRMNDQLAKVDGFDSWADLWAWHEGNGVDDRGMATRDLVGWA